jgi:hypothetical protein
MLGAGGFSCVSIAGPGLLAMLLIAPLPTLAQSATPAVAPPSAASGDFSLAMGVR